MKKESLLMKMVILLKCLKDSSLKEELVEVEILEMLELEELEEDQVVEVNHLGYMIVL